MEDAKISRRAKILEDLVIVPGYLFIYAGVFFFRYSSLLQQANGERVLVNLCRRPLTQWLLEYTPASSSNPQSNQWRRYFWNYSQNLAWDSTIKVCVMCFLFFSVAQGGSLSNFHSDKAEVAHFITWPKVRTSEKSAESKRAEKKQRKFGRCWSLDRTQAGLYRSFEGYGNWGEK